MKEVEQEVYDLLKRMEINFKLVHHKPVFTIDEIVELNLPDAKAVAKSLFIRDDKKHNYYLLVIHQDRKIDLKLLREKICSRRLSFASEDDLIAILGLTKGSVTPLGILNDIERKVKVLFDTDFNNEIIGIHPNTNNATVWLQVSDLVDIIKQHGNLVEFIETF